MKRNWAREGKMFKEGSEARWFITAAGGHASPECKLDIRM